MNAEFSIQMTVAGTDGLCAFSIAQRYSRQLAQEYAQLVSLEISRRGIVQVEAAPGLRVLVEAIVIVTPEGIET